MLQEKFTEVIQTPNLWTGTLLGLSQFNVPDLTFTKYPEHQHPNNLRLGKQIESFVDCQLQNTPQLVLLDKNLQIIYNKRTLGEIDFLFTYKQQPVHLEVVYKFYIYNPSVGKTELEHWIGPNNKDCLIYKLEKLRNKQLPLLHKEETQTYLQSLGLHSKSIKQYVYFKAQLFIPFQSNKNTFQYINKACIKGFYITQDQLHLFSNYSFYIPSKYDWIMPINTNVEWIEYNTFKACIITCKNNNQAPLCWLKHPDGTLYKCFVYFETGFNKIKQ